MKLLLFLSACVVFVHASLDPLYGEPFQTTYKNRGDTLIFPSTIINEQPPYFAEDLNFNAIEGKVLIGAADKLYVLDKNLEVAEGGEYTWNSSSPCTQQDNRLCHNHIRTYQRFPSSSDVDSNSLFVCGTQSGIQPQCRILNVTIGSQLLETGDPNPTQLISAHPDFPGFGEFRKGSSSDSIYFAANYKSTDPRSYDVSYQDVNIRSAGDSAVTSTRLYGWQEGDEYWLSFPAVFVDYQRIDYATQPGQNEELLQFYFIFLREHSGLLSGGDQRVTMSKVIRLCRNDAGVNRTTQDGFTPPNASNQIFTSFMKTLIFCEREAPSLMKNAEFLGAQDFKYDEIWSVAFNNFTGGRFHEERPYVHTVYGAFSGPRVGPIGTAICAYRADMGDPSSSDGLTAGIFDVFRDDVINPRTRIELENNYIECYPGGRDQEDSQRIYGVQDVRQIGENPLVIFEGFYVTQMVVDQVCVVKRNISSSCVNQDVLFLGTSDGRVLKVVFATDGVRDRSILPIFPVVVEEIKLDDTNPIKEMKIESIGSSKQLFVVTSSRIYRLPLERCSRHQNNITSCIGSRDPYCVWDTRQRRCMTSTLSAVGEQMGSVPVYQLQNIHTGMVQHAPELTRINSSTTYIHTGVELRLQCGYVGDPVPTIQWFHNNSLLMDGSGGVSITRGDNDHSSAVIASVNPTSGGIYMCKATNSLGSSELNYIVHVLDLEAVSPPQVLALCSVVLWYSPAVVSPVDTMITGYDVRFYSPQSDTENVIRHVGANRTFYTVQNEDKTVANLEDIYVQIRVIHGHRTTGEWSDGINLECDKPTTPPETPSTGMMCTNNRAASLLVVGEGADALLCNMRYLILVVTLCRLFI